MKSARHFLLYVRVKTSVTESAQSARSVRSGSHHNPSHLTVRQTSNLSKQKRHSYACMLQEAASRSKKHLHLSQPSCVTECIFLFLLFFTVTLRLFNKTLVYGQTGMGSLDLMWFPDKPCHFSLLTIYHPVETHFLRHDNISSRHGTVKRCSFLTSTGLISRPKPHNLN
jgi:hypothetical protein